MRRAEEEERGEIEEAAQQDLPERGFGGQAEGHGGGQGDRVVGIGVRDGEETAREQGGDGEGVGRAPGGEEDQRDDEGRAELCTSPGDGGRDAERDEVGGGGDDDVQV